ncbi:type I-E CRISPR-associated protein Cas5/CasD [Pantoea sp. BAV 3049]|uniref:type I-E CRISPR-associated protein Cas5/CasD n=1 Tax=Pantoea sp. BAV 3049 TaxID=2654188 RepID=UPI00131E73C2|nr:type I-E CRISPR-associated protein Cas5/CasD [Pantoea sp. BAV 3049]
MKQYLVFQLYAPMASWGEEAVGEVRHTAAIPTRSAILGLLAAALGIYRDEEERLSSFNQHYHLAVRPLSTGERWLRDYHTVSVPRENKKYRYYTRRDELCLAPDEVGTIVTQREYRCDGYWHVAVSATQHAPVALEAIQVALLAPHFPLYLGRKSCPLALPLSPCLMSGSLNQVFLQAERTLVASELTILTQNQRYCYWDDPEETSLLQQEQQYCHHQSVSRRRWQFGSYIRYSGILQEME